MSGCPACHRPTYAGASAVIRAGGRTVLVHPDCADPYRAALAAADAQERAARHGATPTLPDTP